MCRWCSLPAAAPCALVACEVLLQPTAIGGNKERFFPRAEASLGMGEGSAGVRELHDALGPKLKAFLGSRVGKTFTPPVPLRIPFFRVSAA